MLNHQFLSPWPCYEPDETQAAMATLVSGKVNYWTGELGRQFEKAYAKYTGQPYGIALSNGTVALELALRAFGIGPGDEVIVASRSYVASASCVLLVGAKPVFADVDLCSGNISAGTIAPLINKRTKAVIPVHVGGLPCDMSPIIELARSHNIRVIEDCAQAHGAAIEGKPVGGWGDAAIFSFCQDKIISTGGEGGMLLLNDETSYKSAWAYKDIGRDYDAVYSQSHAPGFRWYTNSAGSNFRMTEFQAAIGIKQLEKLDNWVVRRNQIADRLRHLLEKTQFIKFPSLRDKTYRHAHYRLYGIIDMENESSLFNCSLRDKFVENLSSMGLPCFYGSCSEIYLEKAFTNIHSGGRLLNAQYYSNQAFCLLTHHTITDSQLEQAEDILNEFTAKFKYATN